MKFVLLASLALVECVFLARHVPQAPSALVVTILVACSVVPLLVLGARRHGVGELPRGVLTVGAWLSLFGLPMIPFGRVAASLVVLVMPHLAFARSPRLRAAALAVGPLFIALEMTRAPAGWLAVVFLLVLGLALVGANLQASAHLRTRARGEQRRSASTSRYLVAYGLVAAFAIVCSLPFLSLPLLALPEARLASGARPDDTRDPRIGLDDSSEATGTVEARTRRALGGRFPDALHLAGRVTRLRHEIVARISARPAAGGEPRNVGPLYLRGLVLDQIGTEGVDAGASTAARSWQDGDDGELDGLTVLSEERLRSGAPVLELSVVQQTLRVAGSERAILFAPEPLIAIDREEVWYDPDGSLMLPDAGEEDWLRFALFVGERAVDAKAVRAADVEQRWLALPDLALVDRLQREATAFTASATTDVERVGRVLAHFAEYEYDLTATSVPGIEGLDEFLAERRGYCAYFALAATVQLRSLGIPTRLATGFLGDRYDAATASYQVTSRDGHVWIECCFAEHGWVAFDPTPSTSRASALARASRGDGLGGWAGALFADLGRWFASGNTGALREFAATLFDGPRALLASPWSLLALLSIGSIVSAGALVRRRRASVDLQDRAGARVPTRRVDSWFVELERLLAMRGLRRSPARTRRAFAAGLVDEVPEQQPRIAEAVEIFYRERFGGQPGTARERALVNSLLEELRTAGANEARSQETS